MRRTSMCRVLVLVLAASAAAAGTVGCSPDFDAGATPDEQLCTVLQGALEVADGPFRLTPLVEEGVNEAAKALAPVAVGYLVYEDEYDDLGPYEAAIRFAATVADPDLEGLLATATPSREVLDSARAADQVLHDGACVSEP